MTILYHSIFGGFNQVSIKVSCERTISQEIERRRDRVYASLSFYYLDLFNIILILSVELTEYFFCSVVVYGLLLILLLSVIFDPN